MRSRVPLLAILLVASALAAPHLVHAAVPFFGPIVPESYATCPGGWGLLMTVINNVISFLLTLIIVFVAPLMIAWGGFLLVTNPFNPDAKTRAKSIIMNTIIGIIVALAAWMIVDLVMAVLYNPNSFGATWTELLTTKGDACLTQAGANKGDVANDATNLTGVDSVGNLIGARGVPTAQCPLGSTICSPAALRAAGFDPVAAEVMSCIAMTESGGNPEVCNKNACGVFQIMLTVNPLTGPACAKYNNGNELINCPAICKGSNGVAVTTSACQPCVQAAKDPQCNATSAKNLHDKNGTGPWTPPDSDNTRAGACKKYGS